MAIELHGFISSSKRYIQVESQTHHIMGIYSKKVYHYQNMRFSQLTNTETAYFECEEDGTITFYQAVSTDGVQPGIWTYIVYQCPENQEKVFRDISIDINISTNCFHKILAGQKLILGNTSIYEYLKYKLYDSEHLDIYLPDDWNSPEGIKIAHLLLEEFKALSSSSLFAEDAGKKYMKTVINKFILIGQEILENGGIIKDFELCQYDILKNVRISEIANLIIEYNDYRLWQAALPSKSKAVEHAFNAALDLICRTKHK